MDKSEWSYHTVNSIAKKIDLVTSTYLRQILNEMVEAGDLMASEFRNQYGSVNKRYYVLPTRVYTQLELGLLDDDSEDVPNDED
jgi:hypothetical protein